MDVKDIVDNTKRIYMSDSSMETLMDFERVLDEVDLYAFKNWKKGELIEGPIKTAHWIECSFMWPSKSMPDPDGASSIAKTNLKLQLRLRITVILNQAQRSQNLHQIQFGL
jgi:hypothetical protein